MPRFYLHLCNGSGFTEDSEGAELSDLEAARSIAIASLRDVMAAELKRGEIDLGSFIEIEDEARQHLITVPFEEAVRITSVPGNCQTG